jgi:serine/threonine protein phosphatase PrpC
MANENAQPEPVQITFAKGTDVGRSRDHNEDYVDAFSPQDPVQRRQKGSLFVVADGMGGHQAGDVASQNAVRVFSHEYYADPDLDVRGSLVRAIKKANAYIHEQAQQVAARAGMGTTIVTAVVRGQELYLANVGDSRAYLMRQGKVSQVTQDHSFVAEQVRAGILTLEEARSHPQRNVITRALGSKPEVKVDTYSGEVLPGDSLLLCSDGLSEYVHEDDMLAMLGQYPAEQAISRMIAMANDRGGSDNISVLVVQGASPPTVPTTESMAAPQPAPQSAPAAAPTATPAAAPARRRSPVPWIAGVAAIGVIAVLAIGAGLIFVPTLLRSEPTVTPTVTPTATSTSTQTAAPTSTERPAATATEGQVTATPRIGLSLESPADQQTVPPGVVTLSWNSVGLPDFFSSVARTEAGVLCQGTEEDSCQVQLAEGDYEWYVEVTIAGQKFESERWTVYVRSPTNTPVPPTATHTPTPTHTPRPQPSGGGGGGGGGGGDDGGDNGGGDNGGGSGPPDR